MKSVAKEAFDAYIDQLAAEGKEAGFEVLRVKHEAMVGNASSEHFVIDIVGLVGEVVIENEGSPLEQITYLVTA